MVAFDGVSSGRPRRVGVLIALGVIAMALGLLLSRWLDTTNAPRPAAAVEAPLRESAGGDELALAIHPSGGPTGDSGRTLAPKLPWASGEAPRVRGPILRVLDGEGHPLGGAEVLREGPGRVPFLTDAAGEVGIAELLASASSLEVSAEGHHPLHLDVTHAYLQPSPWVVRLEAKDPVVHLRGRVEDDRGTPVRSARLTPRTLGGQYLGHSVETDARGAFELPVSVRDGVVPRIRVLVSCLGHFEVHAGPYSLDPRSTEPPPEVTIQLMRMGPAVDGLVLGTDGVGVAGARVVLRGLGTQAMGEVLTDATGFFVWRGDDPERVRSLTVNKGGYADAVYGYQPNETRRGVRITLLEKAPETEDAPVPAGTWIGSPNLEVDPELLEALELGDWELHRSGFRPGRRPR